MAAPINPRDGRVLKAGGVPTWAGKNIREIFEPAFGRPIFADNESNCSAIAQMMWGAARELDDFVLFTVDLGVGGAIVHGGQVITGFAGSAGEFGHMTLDPAGPLCRCGNRGCLERYISDPLIALVHHPERPRPLRDWCAPQSTATRAGRACCRMRRGLRAGGSRRSARSSIHRRSWSAARSSLREKW